MENINELQNEYWWKDKYLQISLIAIRNYQLTKITKFYDYFKYFGEEVKSCDKRISELSGKQNKRKQSEERILSENVTEDLPW